MIQDPYLFYNWSNSYWHQNHRRIHLHFYNIKISAKVIVNQSEIDIVKYTANALCSMDVDFQAIHSH